MFLRQLEYLAALDRERHFARAAAACHVSQPALSAGLRRLETELGVPLVRRGRRFGGFTPEGERVLVWARRALGDLDALAQEAARLRGGLEGTLRLGVIPTALPPSTLVTERFRHRHPRMHVELRSLTSREIAAGLTAGTLDAGLTYLDNEPLEDVDTLALWHERYVLVRLGGSTERGGTPGAEAAPRPPAAIASIRWADAAGLPLSLLTTDMQHRRIVDAAFASAGATPSPAIETNSISTLVAHARTGLPAVIASTWLQAHELAPGLEALSLTDPAVEHAVGLVTRRGGQQSPVVAELMTLFNAFELDEG